MRGVTVRGAFIFGLLSCVAVTGAQPAVQGRVVADGEFADAMTAEQSARLAAQANHNIVELLRAGALAPASAATTVADLQWPLKPAAEFAAYDYHGTKYFVDHDPRSPGFVQDYTCGSRTYDLNTGYNHAGTDYYLWPFPWLMMDQGLVQVVAAAPGIIAASADGNFDRNCAIASGTDPNFVRVLQDDGLSAIYLHLRSGSVTTLPVGARVAAGDYLGLVGSSGQSSGPHLHFELRDANGAVVDPRNGQCNAAPDRWAVFQPYEEPRIDTLSTHSAEPLTVDCGYDAGQNIDEIPAYQDQFRPGDVVWVFASYADQRNGEITNFSIQRPDGSTFAEWTFDLSSQNLPSPFYSGTAWDWQYTLPADAPGGNWRVRAIFQGRTYVHDFAVSAPFEPDEVWRVRAQRGANAEGCRAAAGSVTPQCLP